MKDINPVRIHDIRIKQGISLHISFFAGTIISYDIDKYNESKGQE